MASWPLALKITRDNYTETAPDRVMRSAMEVGPQKVRRRSSAAVRMLSLRLFLNDAQLDILDNFYLTNDAAAFDFTDMRTGNSVRARFVEPPSYSRQETMWDVSAKLEILP